jgi:DnaJ-class molecular chaperone
MAQYHPDKVQHLGLDLQEAARRKTREIGEAYEYFRVKYNLRQASPSR